MENKRKIRVSLTFLTVGVMLLAIPIPLFGDAMRPVEASTPVIFSEVVGDELFLGERVFTIHGDLEDRALYLNDEFLRLNGVVPWWISCVETDGSIHMVVGDAAYRTFLSHYVVSEDGGKTWQVLESFWGCLKPHITIFDGTIIIMFERSTDDDGATVFKLVDDHFEMIKEGQPLSYADVLDYRTTEEYLSYDIARKNEVKGRHADNAKDGRAPTKEWAYIYVCNGEAAGIESYLELDANEMCYGGSSANHWAICLFDDNGAGVNHVRIPDEGGGGGFVWYTMAEVGLPSEPNLGDPNTYITFLEWCFNNYPAINVVWDNGGHGAGTAGCIFDETPEDEVDLVEITTISDGLMTTLGRPINITAWDTCLTMTQEWLYGYKPITNFTVTSMDKISGYGFNYENLMNFLASNNPSPPEMANEIAEDYWIEESKYISVLNTDNWDYTFWPTFNELAQELTHDNYLTEIGTTWSDAWFPYITDYCHDVWEWTNNMNTGISNPTIQALAIQARDEVWTDDYPDGLDDVIQLKYGYNSRHHGVGDEMVTNAAWMIDVETMRDEMITVSGVSNAIPSCSITSPAEGGEIPQNGIWTIQGTASDSDGAVSRVEVKINREWWQLATGTSSWSFNWDLTSDVAYYGLGPYKIWARSFDGTDYSSWQCINVNVIGSYPPAGSIELDRDFYPMEDTITVTVRDGDLTVPSINVNVMSDTEPAGETVTLYETVFQGKYEGTVAISAINSAGILQVSDGDAITGTYSDANDGTGNPATMTDTAQADGDPPQPPTALEVHWVDLTPDIIWLDDFEDGDVSDWTATPGTGTGGVSQDTANSGIWSMYSAGGTYTWDSPIVDLSAIDTADLSIWIRQGGSFGDSNSPEIGEDLEVLYLNDAATWILLETFLAADAAGTIYTPYYTLPTDALHSGFQVRFNQLGGTSGIYDFWHWDDVQIIDNTLKLGAGPDNHLTWALSTDDGTGDNDVDHYDVYRANSEFGPWDASAYHDSVPAGTDAYTDPEVGEFDGINWWYVARAVDHVGNMETNTIAIPEVPPYNLAPCTPNYPSPSNEEIGVSVNPVLSVRTADPNGDLLTVRFYDASGPALMGTYYNVPSGAYTNISWPGLSPFTTYTWYVTADDGEFVTQSPTWSFKTRDFIPPVPTTDLTVDWWGTAFQIWVNEGFYSIVVPPAGWDIYSSGTTGDWFHQNSALAGGAVPEVRFDSGSSGNGTSIMYTGPFDTSGLTVMDLQWRNRLSDYYYYEGARCSIRTSTDGVTWTEAGWYWDDTETPWDMPASLETTTVTANVGSPTFYIGWAVTGNSNALNYWYLDDILLTAYNTCMTEDNLLNWTLSEDDGAGADDVDHYNIYRSDVPSGPWDATNLIDTVSAGVGTYTDFWRGEHDGINWWYVVRAEDIYGNEEMNTNAVPEIPVGDMPPNVMVDAPDGGEAYPIDSMISVDWTALDDKPWGPTPNCWVYYDDDTNPGNGQTLITGSVGADVGTYAWDATGVPPGDYYIHTVVEDSIGQTNEDWSDGTFTILPPTYDIDLTGVGADEWVFVSFPIDVSGNVPTLFDDAALGDGNTEWNIIQWYDNFDKEWKSYADFRPASINDLDVVGNANGFWMHVTSNSGDEMLTVGVPGNYPTVAVNINLYTGWNLVGYPTATSRPALAALSGTSADAIAFNNPLAPYRIEDTTDLGSVLMEDGSAYWLHCTADCTWTLNP